MYYQNNRASSAAELAQYVELLNMIEDLKNWLKEKMSVAKEGFDEWKNYNRYYFAGRLEAFRDVLTYLEKYE